MSDRSFNLHLVSCYCGDNMAATETQTVWLALALWSVSALSDLHMHKQFAILDCKMQQPHLDNLNNVIYV